MKGPPKPMKKQLGPPCEVCGKPRGAGLLFIDHGKCMELLAKQAKVKKLRQSGEVCSDEEIRLRRSRRAASRIERQFARFVSLVG